MNECSSSPCSQECANVYGSYQCYCRRGYQLSDVDGVTCEGEGSPLGWGRKHPLPWSPSPSSRLLGGLFIYLLRCTLPVVESEVCKGAKPPTDFSLVK